MNNKNTKAESIRSPKKYLESRLEKCRENIQWMAISTNDISRQVNIYKALIASCKERDAKIKALPDNDARDGIINQMRIDLPPYQIHGLEQQVSSWGESLDRLNDAIQQEYLCLAEVTVSVALHKIRRNV